MSQKRGTLGFRFYHCVPDSTKFLRMIPHQIRVLASAYRISKFPRIKDNLYLSKGLFIDSGFISAMKKGEKEWADNQQFVIDLAWELVPAYCAQLDVPSEPEMLKKAGLTLEEALYLTVRNAIDFVHAGLPKHTKKVLVVQGWDLDTYQLCIDSYVSRGFFDLPPERYAFAIGSVCMRSPKPRWKKPVADLYEVCSFVRSCVPEQYELHCFGIGSVEWIQGLYEMGITSCDSATASHGVGFNRGYTCRTDKRKIDAVTFQFAAEMMFHQDEIDCALGIMPEYERIPAKLKRRITDVQETVQVD